MKKHYSRKWTMAKYSMLLATVICVIAVAGWMMDKDGAIGILGQGVGLVTVVLGLYSAANVMQKRGKNG